MRSGGLVMALSKYKLGELIRLEDERNHEGKYTLKDVKGISIQKTFIETKADMQDVSLNPYILVKPDFFVYVTVTSRNGEKITLAHNDTENTYIVSSSYIVFSIERTDLLNSDYLFMYFNRPEFDRYSRFNSWGSARETFNWEDMCDIDIELPDLPTQKKYVDIYKAMVTNQQSYECGLEDLKLTYEGFIEQLKKTESVKPILPYIRERTEVNNPLKCEYLRGVGNTGFISPRQERTFDSLTKCNVFYKNDFVYNPSVLCDGAIALNKEYEMAICTEEYVVFYIENQNELIPEYLFIWLKRKETGRYIDFMSIDSVRNRVYFSDLNMISIPIPDINTQKIIVDIYNCYYERVVINEQLKAQIKNICPILIKGSLEEGKR